MEAELKKASEEIKRLREESSALRQENIKLKEEKLRLRSLGTGDKPMLSPPLIQTDSQQASNPMMQMVAALVIVLVGYVLGKFIL